MREVSLQAAWNTPTFAMRGLPMGDGNTCTWLMNKEWDILLCKCKPDTQRPDPKG